METSPHGPLTPLLTDWDEAEGKTIASVIEEKKFLVFRFTDGSGLLLSELDPDDPRDIVYGSPSNISKDYSRDRIMRVYFGLDSVEQYKADEARRDEEIRRHDEARLRQEYERLRRIFEMEDG